MAGLTDTLNAAAATRNQFNDWYGLARKQRVLRTKYAKTEPGVPRELNIENALELGFVAAQVRAGTDVADAVVRAGEWMSAYTAKTLKRFVAINTRTMETYEYSDPSYSFEDLSVAIPDAVEGGWKDDSDNDPGAEAAEIYIIDRAAITNRIERLFPRGVDDAR